MRLWHVLFGVFMAACVLTAARTDAGRVAIVVFVFGLVEVVCCTAAIMALFRTVGAMGEAKHLATYAVAFAATVLVVLCASLVMNSLLWVAVAVIQRVVA